LPRRWNSRAACIAAPTSCLSSALLNVVVALLLAGGEDDPSVFLLELQLATRAAPASDAIASETGFIMGNALPIP